LASDSLYVNEDETVNLSYGVENDFVTRYIWHGLSYNHGFIHQPSIWLSISDFTFFSWASLTQKDVDNNTINNEVDFAIQYAKQVDEIYLESSLTYIYALQQDAPATTEAYLKLAYQIFETEIYSDVTMDIMEYKGSLSGDIGVSKTFYETEQLSVSAGMSLGWANNKFNKNYIGISKNIKAFNCTMLFAEASYNLFNNIYLKPHIEYCYLLSPIFKNTSGNGITNFGIAAGIEF